MTGFEAGSDYLVRIGEILLRDLARSPYGRDAGPVAPRDGSAKLIIDLRISCDVVSLTYMTVEGPKTEVASTSDRRQWSVLIDNADEDVRVTTSELRTLFNATAWRGSDDLARDVVAAASKGQPLLGKFAVAQARPSYRRRRYSAQLEPIVVCTWRIPPSDAFDLLSPLAGRLWRDALAGVDGAEGVLGDLVAESIGSIR